MENLKQFFRVVAFDDGYFKPKSDSNALLVGVIYRPENRVEGIISTSIKVDGLNSTKKIISLLKKSKFLGQVSFILLSGVNFAGFNIADIQQLHKRLGKPVIVVLRHLPDFKEIFSALRRFKDCKKRVSLIEKAGKISKFNSIYFQFAGCDERIAKQVLKKTIVNANIPEPIRLAHLIASGITIGESTRP